jgi:CBS-domain-containing membrane protein
MTKIAIDDVDGRSAADVMHPTLSTVPSDATVGDLQAYFAVSSSRRLAVLVEGERYVGAIGADELAATPVDPAAAASALVHRDPIVSPTLSAAAARDHALATPTRRVPVVDEAGVLVGVVAIDKHLAGFCGTES